MQLCPTPLAIYNLHPPLSWFSHAALEKQSTLPQFSVGLQPTFSGCHSHSFFETVIPKGIMPSAKSSGHSDHPLLVPCAVTLHYFLPYQPDSSPGSQFPFPSLLRYSWSFFWTWSAYPLRLLCLFVLFLKDSTLDHCLFIHSSWANSSSPKASTTHPLVNLKLIAGKDLLPELYVSISDGLPGV